MDLNALFSQMNEKGYYYFEGSSSYKDSLWIEFTTEMQGKGNAFEVYKHDDVYDVGYWFNHRHLLSEKSIEEDDLNKIIKSIK